MTGPIRVGIMGGGGILGAHAPGFAAARELGTVVAVAEPDESKHQRIRELLGADVRMEKDYRDVASAGDVEAVDILLPHDLHMPAAVAAARAGKHVMVEKVMARNIWECDRMIAACREAGVTLTVCHDRRYHGQWMALKEVVDSGALGEIHYWKLDHNQDVNPAGAQIPWAANRDRLGGGAIMSCLTHQIDALRWLGGEVARLTCMTKTLPRRMEGESLGVITAEMDSGALAQLSINWTTRSNRGENALWYEMVQVCGSQGEAYYMSGKGTFAMLYAEAPELEWEFTDGRKPQVGGGFVKVASGDWRGHVRCIEQWLRMLRGESSSVNTAGEEVRGTVEVAEAAALSAETGRTVNLPIEPRPWEPRAELALTGRTKA